jgi:hypothetical protein
MRNILLLVVVNTRREPSVEAARLVRVHGSEAESLYGWCSGEYAQPLYALSPGTGTPGGVFFDGGGNLVISVNEVNFGVPSGHLWIMLRRSAAARSLRQS